MKHRCFNNKSAYSPQKIGFSAAVMPNVIVGRSYIWRVGDVENTIFLKKLSIEQHMLAVPLQVGYHILYAWYYDGDYHYNNPTTVSVYSDKTVTAYYIYPY
jgi:hypothetical protein